MKSNSIPFQAPLQDHGDLGLGYHLTVELEPKVRAILEKDTRVIWESAPYPNLTEFNIVVVGEELRKAKVLPEEISFESKIFIPITERAKKEYYDQAIEDPLEFIDRALERTVKYDKMHRRLVLLGMLSCYCPSPLNVTLKAETTTGKSWIMTQTAAFLPEEDVLKYCDASPTAFYWKFGKIKCKEHGDECPSDTKCRSEKYKHLSFKHKILMFLDQPNDQLLQHMKPLLSHDEKTLIRLATDPNKRGSTKAVPVHLEGWPSLCYASCQQQTDPEIASRTFIISPDDSRDKVDEVLHFQALKEKDPSRWRLEYESDLSVMMAKRMIRETRELVERYKTVEVEKPYIEELEKEFRQKFPTSPRSLRAFPQLLGLIDAVTLLNFRKRANNMCVGGGLKITSTVEDAKVALEIIEYFLEGLKYGLSSAVVEVFNKIIQPLIREKGTVSRRDIVLKYRDVKGRYLGEKYLSKYYLEPILDRGLLNADADPGDKRRVLYSLNIDTGEIKETGGGGCTSNIGSPTDLVSLDGHLYPPSSFSSKTKPSARTDPTDPERHHPVVYDANSYQI